MPQEMLMSRRLPEANTHRSSSIKRRLFQDEEEDSEDPDDEDSAEHHRRLQLNRESETENFLNRQAEQLDGISRERWNFDFRNETPVNNNGGQWEWNMQVVKLSQTSVPKLYLNVLDHNGGDLLDGGPSSSNCPTCSKNIKLDNDNISTPTKSTDVNESQTPMKKRLVKESLESIQCSSSIVPKSSSSNTPSSLPSSASAVSTETVGSLADGSYVDSLDDVVPSKQDNVRNHETPDTKGSDYSNNETQSE